MDKELLLEIITSKDECEWIEYKENWFNKKELGGYISALSNSAAEHGEEYGYFIWGVEDKTRKIVGTDFNPDIDVNNEPLKHYLARLLTPSIAFLFEKFVIEGLNIVCLSIPASKRIITEFDKRRYLRIGSSKVLLRNYPEREADLWVNLRNGIPTIINTPSPYQDLIFSQLISYYLSKGLSLNPNTFKDNLHLFVPNTSKYNELAYILSDNNDITCRVSIFSGKKKSDNQYSLNDFGRKSILLTIDQILYFINSYNTVKIDETNRVVERKDTPLFDSNCFHEALLNSFIHNDWVDLNAPMISIFTDRIEILSFGSLPSKQTRTGFFAGKSKPRSQELAEIFLQLRISERSGRGVTRIVDKYGEEVFEIAEDFIKVTIPFAYERYFGLIDSNKKSEQKTEQKTEQKSEQKTGQKSEQKSDKRIIKKNETIKKMIITEMKNNSYITTKQLMQIIGLKKTSIQTYIKILTSENKIERINGKKGGYWKVNEI